jgi:predicted nuclease of predicted toxin-antitoxin system
MNLLVDNQLPQALAAYFRHRGDKCEHVLDIGLGSAGDTEVWDHAMKLGQIVVSKDEDFVTLANRPGDQGRLIWVRLGNCRNAALFAAFDQAYDGVVQALDAGTRIIEVR